MNLFYPIFRLGKTSLGLKSRKKLNTYLHMLHKNSEEFLL